MARRAATLDLPRLPVAGRTTRRAYYSLEDLSAVTALARERESADVDIFSWVRAYRYINGERWSYDSPGPSMELGERDAAALVLRRPYLRQYVQDQTRERSVVKCRQSELTENQINENLYYAVKYKAKIAHIFPTDRTGEDVGNEKVRPAIQESPAVYDELIKPGAVKRYMFRSGGVYSITGVFARAGGRTASRDLLCFDEWDFMPSGVFGIFESLISHSALQLVRKISTPTVPGVGIDAEFSSGCGYIWHFQCPKCGKEQDFSWPENLIGFFDSITMSPDDPGYRKKLDQVYIGCRHCGEYIDRNSDHYCSTGRWIPERPDLAGDHASYRINGAMIPWKTGKELLRRYHKLESYVWQWYNENFGVAYLKADNRLSEGEILRCQAEWTMLASKPAVLSNVSVGVDWGEKQSWVVVSGGGMNSARQNQRAVVYVEEINADTLRQHGYSGKTVEHAERVIDIVEHFQAQILVDDANGIGIDRHKRLADKFPRRSWGAFFDTAERGRQLRQSKLLAPDWQRNKEKVTISKTFTVKEIQQDFRAMQIDIPAIKGEAGDVLRKFVRHNTALAIQPRWNEEYEQEFEICVKLLADDHLFDAHIYSKVGYDKLTGRHGEVAAFIITGH